MRTHSLRKYSLLTVFAVLGYLMASCQNQSRLPNNGQINTPNPFEGNVGGDFNDNSDYLVGDDDDDDAIDGAQGITIQNLLDELAGINPQSETDLPGNLEQDLLDGMDATTAAEKIALAGQVLSHCFEQMGDYLPRPGEPLQGYYKGNGKCEPSEGITITGIYQKIFKKRASTSNPSASGVRNSDNYGAVQNNPTPSTSDTQNPGFANGLGLGNVKFTVSAGKSATTNTNDANSFGVMNVQANGVGAFKLGKYTGAATDVASAGKPAPRVELSRPEETDSSGKHTTPGCTGSATMVSSANPIPEKAVEGYKIVGQCYRKALILFSPDFDKVFRNMDPAMKRIFQQRILGLSTSTGR